MYVKWFSVCALKMHCNIKQTPLNLCCTSYAPTSWKKKDFILLCRFRSTGHVIFAHVLLLKCCFTQFFQIPLHDFIIKKTTTFVFSSVGHRSRSQYIWPWRPFPLHMTWSRQKLLFILINSDWLHMQRDIHVALAAPCMMSIWPIVTESDSLWHARCVKSHQKKTIYQ